MGLSSKATKHKPTTDLLWKQLDASVNWPMVPPNAVSTAPEGITLRAVTSTDTDDLSQLMTLFLQLFPTYKHFLVRIPSYCEPFSHHHKGSIGHVWLVHDDRKLIGLRFFSYFIRYNFGHGDFLGLLPDYHERGIGRWLVAMTHAQLALDAFHMGCSPPCGYTAEIVPRAAGKPFLPSRMFHQRAGARRLHIDYREPVIENNESLSDEALVANALPMDLLFYPRDPHYILELSTLEAMIKAIYQLIYLLPAHSPLEDYAIASLEGQVRYDNF